MHGHQPRKRFGQNFLADPHYVARILDAVAPREGDNVVEIGPGLAALTAGLIERAGRITAIEIDRDLAARLRDRFHAGAARRCTTATRSTSISRRSGDELRVVGNLPYNISSPLLFHLDAIRVAPARRPRDAAEGSRRAHGSGAGRRRTMDVSA